MNPLALHLHAQHKHRRIANVLRDDKKSRRPHDYFALWNDDAITGRAIPDARHSIASVFRDRCVNVENRHTERFENRRASHVNPPPSDDTHHCTSVGNRTWKLVASLGNRFRGAPCPVSVRTILNGCGHLEIAA